MRLSKKTEYSLLALIELGRNYEKHEVIKISDLAQNCDIPKKFLEQILLQLKGNGYVISQRGWKGGYKLTKKPQEICLAEIIRVIDGPLAPVNSVSEFFYQKTPIEKNKKLLACFKEIREYTVNKLEGVTVYDFLE